MARSRYTLRHIGVISFFLLVVSTFGADKHDLPSPQQLLDAATKLSDLSSLYPYQLSAHIVINRGTSAEKSGTLIIYRDKKDYRYELRIEDYREVAMRQGNKLYTFYSAFPAPGFEVTQSIDKWPAELTSKTITGHTSRAKLGNIEGYCVNFKTPHDWQLRGCFDPIQTVLLEVSEKSQTRSFLDYQIIGEQQFPRKIKILRRGLSQDIEVEEIRVQKMPPGPVTMEIPKDAREFETCDDTKPAELVSTLFANPRLQPIYSGKPIVTYFHGVIDKNGDIHDLEVYSPTTPGHEHEKEWKELALAWRFKPATCNGRPIVSEFRSSIAAGVD